jgi:hypothetical protein
MDASRFDQWTRQLSKRISRRAALGTALAGLALTRTGHTSAQETGQNGTPAADGEKPVFMFVQTAVAGRGEVNPSAGTPTSDGTPTPGSGAPFLLTLEGHSGQTVYFSDRPERIVGSVPSEDFLDTLGFEIDNPPNAALVAEFEAGQGVIVMELMMPTYDEEAGTLTYGVEGLGTFAGSGLEPVARDQVVEHLPAEFGAAALFIDDCPDLTDCKRPWTSGAIIQHVVGPIPGGPYGQCWSWKWPVGCHPCWTTEAYLTALCNTTYADCEGACRFD